MDPRGKRVSCLLIGLWLATAPPAVSAAVENPVQAGQEALRRTKQPWYDAETDQVRPWGNVRDRGEPDRVRYQPSESPRWDWDWNWGFSWLGDLFQVLAWSVLILLIGSLIYALVRTYLNLAPVRDGDGTTTLEEADALTETRRIENLPLEVRAPRGDFLALAQQHYDAGNLAEAIVYLFSYQLLRLDKAGYIRLTKGKTNRQYLVELRRVKELQLVLGQTMLAFEDVFFGRLPLERERFQRCWDRNKEFEQLIARALR